MVKTYHPLFEGHHNAREQQAGIGKLSRFGWYNLLYTAAGGQLAQLEAIKKMNVHMVFQFLLRQREEQRFFEKMRNGERNMK